MSRFLRIPEVLLSVCKIEALSQIETYLPFSVEHGSEVIGMCAQDEFVDLELSRSAFDGAGCEDRRIEGTLCISLMSPSRSQCRYLRRLSRKVSEIFSAAIGRKNGLSPSKVSIERGEKGQDDSRGLCARGACVRLPSKLLDSRW